MINQWKYRGKLLFQRSAYKWALLILVILFSIAFILPKEQYKDIMNYGEKKDIWIVNCHISSNLITELKNKDGIDSLYPLYALQAELIQGEYKKSFALYGISKEYFSDTKIEENMRRTTIFLPKEVVVMKQKSSNNKPQFSIGKEKVVQKQYLFSNICESNNNFAYIAEETAEKIIRETSVMRNVYDGLCVQISSSKGVQEVEDIVIQLEGESSTNFKSLKSAYLERNSRIRQLIFYIVAGFSVIELIIVLITNNLWLSRGNILNDEYFTESYRKKIKRYLFIKMNCIVMGGIGSAVILMLLDVI